LNTLTRRQWLGAWLSGALGAGSVGAKTAAEAAAIRRWRHYVPARTGQVHVFSATPDARTSPRALPLICLHPSPTSGEMYADLQRELARDRTVHCLDTPGYGASDAPASKPTIEDYGAALADAASSLAPKFDVFGFHTGSLCAIELVLQAAGRVRRLVLSGVPHYGTAAERERQRRANVVRYPYFDDPDYVARMYRRLVLEARDSGSPAMRLRRFGDRLRAGQNGWWAPDAVFIYDTSQSLPRLAVPTLMIAFREEMTEPTRAAARLVRGAQLIEMLDLPIFGFIVDPPRVASAIRGFLDA
jgi:pimeloyl-ACP methyl ester carboxylesterase